MSGSRELAGVPFQGNSSVLSKGFFGTNSTAFENFKVSNYTMYFNGDFKTSRVFNASYNDYAETIKTEKEYEPGQVVIENGIYQGICSNTYGRNMGEGNTVVALMGRVPVEMEDYCKIGDLVYFNGAALTIEKSNQLIGKIIDFEPQPVILLF